MDAITSHSHGLSNISQRPWRTHTSLFAFSKGKAKRSTIPGTDIPRDVIYDPKGKLLGGGVTGIVEKMPTGLATKTPWPGPENEDCRRDLTLEAEIYRVLGEHKCLVQIREWNPEECILTMDCMVNGCLDEYLREHDTDLTPSDRFRGTVDLADVLCLLHSKGVLHCDLKPNNMLLDADLQLKLIDFSCSSLHDSKPSGFAGYRFVPPGDLDARGVKTDIFALGSTLYHIMTGAQPYADLKSDQVWPLYRQEIFPDTASIECGKVISKCWSGEYENVEEIRAELQACIYETANE